MKTILKEVLEDIKPDEELKVKTAGKIEAVLSRIRKRLKGAKVILGGSGAKGTWLNHANDADIFVCFSYRKYKDRSDKLSDILEKKLKKSFNGIEKLHGSRDYFQWKKEGFTFEIVPILEVKKAEMAVNITDVSPLHADWVKSNSDEKLRDQIRLTKQFCKANDAYGAESYIKGFSGYMCEVLTIHYGSFSRFIRAVSRWGKKVIIDTEKYYKGKNIMMELNKSKLHSPLILIDPVQKDRNAAAALSEEKFNNLIRAAKKFLKRPSKRLFREKKVTYESLKKKAGKNKLVFLEVKTLKRKEDVAGAKLVKAFDFLVRKLEDNGFRIRQKGWQWDKEEKGLIYFIIDKKPLSKIKVHEGPSVKMEEHAKRFRKKHKDTFVKKGRVFARVKRDFRKPEELVKKVIKSRYIKEKVKGIRIR